MGNAQLLVESQSREAQIAFTKEGIFFKLQHISDENIKCSIELVEIYDLAASVSQAYLFESYFTFLLK